MLSLLYFLECSQPPGTGNSEFEKYLSIRDSVEKIRNIQKGNLFA